MRVYTIGTTYNSNITSPSFRAKIHDCIKDGDYEGFKRELESRPSCLNEGDYLWNTTPLMFAIINSNQQMIDDLLSKEGLKINKKNDYGDTALHYARKGSTIEKILTIEGIDVNIKDRKGLTPLYRYCKDSDEEAALHLINRMDTNINTRDKDGVPLIKYAAYQGLKDVFNALLQREDIDINAKNYNGETVLYLNLYGKGIDYKALLDRPDIDLNIRDKYGETPLVNVCACGYSDNALMLLDKPEVDINSQDYRGRTAVINVCLFECHGGMEPVLEKLLDKPDINLLLEDEEGLKAVDYARKRHPNLQLPPKLMQKLEDMTNAQLANAKSDSLVKTGVIIEKLNPEQNVWSQKEITEKFINTVKQKQYGDSYKMLKATPLIDLTKGSGVVKAICASGDEDLTVALFDYKFNKQEGMRKKYEKQRKAVLDRLRGLSYYELKQNPIALYTNDGFELLFNRPEFNPNDKAGEFTLFEAACLLGSKAPYAKAMLSKEPNIDTSKAKKNADKKLQSLIGEYEKMGKYKIRLGIIRKELLKSETETKAVQDLKKLISNPKFNIKITDEVGNNILHVASALKADGARGIIQTALSKGIDINSKNVAGQTPLMIAIKQLFVSRDENEKSNILSNIKFLLDKGANVDEQDKIGQTALHYACSTLSAALLGLLLSKNPNLSIIDLNGNSPSKYLKTDEMKKIYYACLRK